MTLLICPVREGENGELRYALRSWDSHLIMPDLTLMVVGDKPDWLEPDMFLPGNKHEGAPANVFSNVLLGAFTAMMEGVEEAIYMNDDFFCMEPVLGVVPVRRNISLAEHIALYPQYQTMWWIRSLNLTASWLAEAGFPHPHSYEVHRPLLCKPSDMFRALTEWDGGLDGDLPQWRTVYGTLNKVDAYPVGDVKLGSPGSTPHSTWVSTSDSSWRRYRGGIMKSFQKPSRWER